VKLAVVIVIVPLIVGTVLDWNGSVMVLLRKNLLVVHWLDGGVVVILMNLTICCDLTLLPLHRSDGLLLYAWVHALVDGSVMLTMLREKAAYCLLRLVHID